jgi:hypothetical protein
MTEEELAQFRLYEAIDLVSQAYSLIKRTPQLKEVQAGTSVLLAIMIAIRDGVVRKGKVVEEKKDDA